MDQIQYDSCVLFGGNGFIGSNFADYLLKEKLVKHITIADSRTITPDMWPNSLRQRFSEGLVDYARVDVRKPIANQTEAKRLPTKVDLIVNLAAVHKEPGHKADEYFETNIPGAENVCDWASEVYCDKIIFTSSIAVYGGSSSVKSEKSLTMPLSPYGVSKLAAEKIHLGWQKEKPGRQLMIVRPGVIFGAGEQGNVTRMVKAVLGKYFFFTGNKKVRKAGGYVKELCLAMGFMLKWQEQNHKAVTLFNFTMDPAPSVEEYTKGITKVAGVKRLIPNMPYWMILSASYGFLALSKLMRRKQSISPTTVRKVLKYNNITPQVLKDLGYKYHYSLEQGLADWYKERPQDW